MSLFPVHCETEAALVVSGGEGVKHGEILVILFLPGKHTDGSMELMWLVRSAMRELQRATMVSFT